MYSIKKTKRPSTHKVLLTLKKKPSLLYVILVYLLSYTPSLSHPIQFDFQVSQRRQDDMTSTRHFLDVYLSSTLCFVFDTETRLLLGNDSRLVAETRYGCRQNAVLLDLDQGLYGADR